MNRNAKWIYFVLILCMLSGLLSFAYAETTETKPAEEPAQTEEAALANNADKGPKEPALWTVMLYLCGSDLESVHGMATANLEMISKTVPDNRVNVVIETGGAKEWQTKETVGIDIANNKIQRWSYSEDGFKLENEVENASMAKYTTLADFISWSAENFPAEKNILIMWDHGGGSSSGLIVDELHDDATMSLDCVERALKEAGVHFDIFMTDTCLMANIETAQIVKPYADYLLASEEILPGMGSNYKEFLQNLYDEPECKAVRLGRMICNATELMYAEMGDNSDLKGLTLSLIDLSRIDEVAEAFEAYMREVVSLIPDPVAFGTYLAAVKNTDRYMNRDMWDLYDLARRSVSGGISKKTALRLENAVDDAVLTSVRGAYHPYSHGLSAFLVYNGDTKKLDRFARGAQNPWQMAFLDAVSLKWDAPEWVTYITGDSPELKPELYTVKFETETSEDKSKHFLYIYSGIESGGFIRYELQRYDETLQVWYTLGENENVDLISMDDEKYTFVADFTGKWPALNGEFLSISSKDLEGNTVLMQAQVFLPAVENKVKKLRILATYPKDLFYHNDNEETSTGTVTEEKIEEKVEEKAAEKATVHEQEEDKKGVTYEVAGLWDGYDSSTGLADRNTWSPAQLFGAQLQVCRPVYSDFMNDIGDMRFSEPMEINFDMEIKDTVLPAGRYRLRYSIMDLMDRTSTSDFINLTWDGEKVVFEVPEEENNENQQQENAA